MIISPEPFVYVTKFSAVAQNAIVTQPLNIDPDFDFVLRQITASTSAQGATDTYPNEFELQIKNATTGRFWSNDYVPQRCICDSRINLFGLPVVIRANSNWTIYLSNVYAGILTATICWVGAKIAPGNSI